MCTAVIVAAGKGLRMQRRRPKQYLPLDGRPVLALTLAALDACPRIHRLVLVVPEPDLAYCRRSVLSAAAVESEVVLVAGGPRRQDSVYNGMSILDREDPAHVVLIHDGVRPFVHTVLVDACIDGARRTGACIPVLPVHDTVKQVDASGAVRQTLDRENLRLTQTPQAFQLGLIRKAHEQAMADRFQGTDDACLVERLGRPVSTVEGSRTNIKITTPEDLATAASLLAEGRVPPFFSRTPSS